jgi:hypothetical protein
MQKIGDLWFSIFNKLKVKTTEQPAFDVRVTESAQLKR